MDAVSLRVADEANVGLSAQSHVKHVADEAGELLASLAQRTAFPSLIQTGRCSDCCPGSCFDLAATGKAFLGQ